MPRAPIDNNKRMNLRVRPEQKAALMRAAALRNTDLTDFVLQPALREAKSVIEKAERIVRPTENVTASVHRALDQGLSRVGTRKIPPPAPLSIASRHAEVARFSRSTRGCRAATRSSASAGPSGLRRPCSQLRKV